MALNSLFCADVPLSNYSLTHPTYRTQTVALKPVAFISKKKSAQTRRMHVQNDIFTYCTRVSRRPGT